MTILRDHWGEVEPPSPAAQARARAALLASVAETGSPAHPAATRRRPVWSWRSRAVTVAAGVVALAALAAGVMTVGGAGGPVTLAEPPSAPAPSTRPPVGSTAQTFELAARYAAAQPFTAPRPDQWIYVELRQSLASAVAGFKGLAPERTVQSWKRADGLQEAVVLNGVLTVLDHQIGSEMPPTDYPTLAGLPVDPQVLLGWFQSRMGPDGTDSTLFSVIASIVGQNVLPPDVAAALLRVAALIPGVTETPEPTTIDGRPVTALGRVMDGWRQFDVLLDADTHAVIGYRNVAVADYRDPGGHVEFHRGDLMDMVILKAALVVDAPGQTS